MYAFILGVNDIGTAATDPATQQVVGDKLIAAYQQITRDAKAKGFKVFAATITALGSTYTGGSREDTRQRINNWILTNGTFDAVVDFDKILRNPDSPSQLQARFDSGDGLHPNVAGYQTIADNFPLEIFGTRSGAPAIPKWGQCGGLGFLGKGACMEGTKCVVSAPPYSVSRNEVYLNKLTRQYFCRKLTTSTLGATRREGLADICFTVEKTRTILENPI